MLSEIRIRGLGVIEDVTLELGPGLTVVTGETGAGKTMVVTGLHLLFGGRADPQRVRSGSGRAVVDGRLRLPPGSPVLARAVDAGAEIDEDGDLLVSRAIAVEGRSRAYLGGSAVPASLLGELAEGVLALHGQSDQLRLLKPAEQRASLDRYGALAGLVDEHRAAYGRWRALADDLADRTARARELAREADGLRTGLAEIAAVEPQPGEDTQLAVEADKLAHADALRLAARQAHLALAGDPDDPAADGVDMNALLGTARRALAHESAADPELAALGKRLDELAYLASDIGTELASYGERLDADPARLAAVEDRRAALKALTRKYGDVEGTVEEVLAWAGTAAERLATLDVSEDALAALAAERDAARDETARLAAGLSAARHEAADRFGTAVTAELAGLAMPRAVVSVDVHARPATGDGPSLELAGERVAIGPDGVDEVEVLLRPHPGAPPLPVQRGASGGELSRVMLAIEVVFAGSDPVPTMVFDEVDAGVGGRAAVEVGRRLARLAADHQVLVVTHLPQVAAYADAHVVVDKADSDGALVTRSDVRVLDDAGRVRELARMLAGLDDSELGRAHAEELLATAAADRQR
ncbi:MAG TPA: DNA repair protein RecN [Mycobacteriales bacterium]